MFNLKFIANLDSSSKEKLVASLTEFVTDSDLRISLYNHGNFDRAKQFFDANIHKISDSKLKALYEEAAGRGWENKIQKVIKEKKKIAELESNERIQALTRTAENQKRQNDLQKEVEVLKTGLAQEIVSFLQKNPTKSLNDFDFSTYEVVWGHLRKESDTDEYTQSDFNIFLKTIDVYRKNIGTPTHTPKAQPAVNEKDDSEGFGISKPVMWGVGIAALFGVWTFFSQIGKSPKPIESSIKVGEANISKQEVKRLIDLLDELKIILIAEEGSVGDYALGVRNFDLTPAFLQYAETLQTIFISGAVDRETYARVTPHIMYFVKHQAEMPMAFSIHSKKFQIDSIEYKQDIKATHGYLSAIYLNLVVAEAIILTNPAEGAALVDLIFNVSFQKFTKVETILDNLEDNADLIEIKEKLGRLKKKAVHLKEKFERVR